MKLSNLPIGIFDSGVGGLTVFKAIRNLLPQENLVYFGDLARVPYGMKSPRLIQTYSLQIAKYLIEKSKVKALVVACNTASSTSLEILKENFNLPILGVILPGVEEALRITRNGRIGVIGTRTTIKTGAYQKALLERKKGIEVFAYPTPLLVPLVEEGWLENRVARLVVREYLAPFIQAGVDTLILGCTHYPLLKKIIGKEGKGIMLVDSSQAVARKLKEILEEKGLKGGEGKEEFYLTDIPQNFSFLFRVLLGREPENVKLVKLEELL